MLDFTRCVRPDGSAYGTSGRCRKGVEGSKSDREGRRDKILTQAKHHKNTTLENLNENIETLSNLIRNEPGFKNDLTISTLKALRLLRLKDYLASSEAKRKEKEYLSIEIQDLIAGSPKYSSTPGRRSPIHPLSPEEEVSRLATELDSLRARVGILGEPKNSAEKTELILLREEGISLEKNLAEAKKGNFQPPSLSSLYERQGFNSKPQVVPKASDLDRMPGLMKSPEGKTVVAYRGVTSPEFALQFKGGGPEGDIHFPGKGVFGNGSYAAAEPFRKPPSPGKASIFRTTGDSPQKIASNYTNLWDEEAHTDLRREVTAFAFRGDARVATFETEKEFNSWKVKTLAEAKSETGYPFNDIGAAAAAMGYHAYNIPVLDSSDYWVVLNRGAIVVAADSELRNEEFQ